MTPIEPDEQYALLSNCFEKVLSLPESFQLSDVDHRIRAIWRERNLLDAIIDVDSERHRSFRRTLSLVQNLLENDELSFWERRTLKKLFGELESQLNYWYNICYSLLQSSQKSFPMQLHMMEQIFGGLTLIEVGRKWNRILNRIKDPSIYPPQPRELEEGLFDALIQGFREIEVLARSFFDDIRNMMAKNVESRRRLAEKYTKQDVSDTELRKKAKDLVKETRELPRLLSAENMPSGEEMKKIQDELDRLDINLLDLQLQFGPIVQERLRSTLKCVKRINTWIRKKHLDIRIPRNLTERLDEWQSELLDRISYAGTNELLDFEESLSGDLNELFNVLEDVISDRIDSRDSALVQISESDLPDRLKEEISTFAT